MDVIEKFIMGKYGKEELCEDGIVVTDHFIAVIDGVSSKTSRQYHNKSTGKVACEMVAAGIHELSAESNHLNTFRTLNKQLYSWYKDQGIADRLRENPSERPAACVVLYSKHAHQLWCVGDCQALYDGILVANRLKIDELTTNIRCQVIEFLLSTGMTEAELLRPNIANECVQPIFNLQPHIQNRVLNSAYDYTVLDGFGLREDLIRVVELPKNVKEVVLASDGYPKLFSSLDETEEYLRYILREDPLCYKIFKNDSAMQEGKISFDDRSYIRFAV